MTWVSIIAMIFTGCGLVISIISLLQSKKAREEAKNANKAVLKQNIEKELADIVKELADIEVQIERAKADGQQATKGIFGVDMPNPRIGEIMALWEKRDKLTKRKQEIERQL